MRAPLSAYPLGGMLPVAAATVVFVAGCTSSASTPPPPTTRVAATTTAAAPSGVSTGAPGGDIPALVRQVEPSVVTVLTETGLGSGIVYKADGTIVTDAHVVVGASQVKVAFADGQQVAAKVRAADQVTDVAVLQADRAGCRRRHFRKHCRRRGRWPWSWAVRWGFRTRSPRASFRGCIARFPAPPRPVLRWWI